MQEAVEEEQQGEAAIQAVLSGAIAKVVFKSAIAAIPDSLSFRHSFLKLLAQFKFEGVAAIQQTILDSIHRDFGDTEESWDLRARTAAAASVANGVSAKVIKPSYLLLVYTCCLFCLLLPASSWLFCPHIGLLRCALHCVPGLKSLCHRCVK